MKKGQSTKKSAKVVKPKKKAAESAFLYQEGFWEGADNQIVFCGTEKDAIQFFKNQTRLLGNGRISKGDDDKILLLWSPLTSDGMWASIQQVRLVRAKKTKT